MAKTQKYGIKYPFTKENNEELYIDVNNTYEDSIKSRVLHVVFTPKKQRLRMPAFGSDLIRFIFEPDDGMTMADLKSSLKTDIETYVPEVIFDDINVYDDPTNEHGKIVDVGYSIKKGSELEKYNVAVKI